MYKVYILQSTKYGRYYIGHTNNLVDRLRRHNKGYVKSTTKFKPWQLVFFENFNTKSEAHRREMEIKSYKSGIKFKKLLGLWKD